MQTRLFVLAACLGALLQPLTRAADLPGPQVSVTSSNTQRKVTWTPYPAADLYRVFSASGVTNVFTNDTTGAFSGPTWTSTNASASRFYKVAVTPMSSNALLNANVLNRLAYGPTPDELERVAAIGPQTYINEQLAPDGIPETLGTYSSQTTNSAPTSPPADVWYKVVQTGTFTSTNFYIYMNVIGEAYLDDIVLVAGTNAEAGANVLVNGDFESALTPTWTVSPNHVNSRITNNPAHSGSGSLHVVANPAGSTQGSSIWQSITPGLLTNNQPCTLSYWYLPKTNYGLVTLRLSGSGINTTAGPQPPSSPPQWIYFTQTGKATSTTLYLYLTQGGNREGTIDDLKLVAGSVPEAGANLIQGGDFEADFPGTAWTVSTNLSVSAIRYDLAHSGTGSLHVVSSSAGATLGSSIYQTNVPVTVNQTYTLSYWYYSSNLNDALVRFSGADATTGIYVPSVLPGPADKLRRLDSVKATRADLRAWFTLHATYSKRQLFEVLSQFIENHFVTQYSKSVEYFDPFYDGGLFEDRYATDFEFREMSRWRNALLNPDVTFYDLLRISAESPAMIIYLDTVNSKGNGANIANENYARELMELFCNGVDNGYDQNDIVQMSRCWTGWSVALVDTVNKDNPFAAPSTTTLMPGASINTVSNLAGTWAFNYKQANHNNNAKYLFYNWDINGARLGPKIVPARFGAPWAGTDYSLIVTNGSGTNSIQDGYQAIAHLAKLPFTSEYLSVKLCRLFIHDDFPNPTTRTVLPEYSFYDYTNPNRSAEAELVHQCMLAWENSTPKGKIRPVLQTIFNSDLFRAHSASMQKVKTPFEFVVSTVRALMTTNATGATAFTDGASYEGPMSRMGSMGLFNRAEPNGYPENGPSWISAGTLAERLRYVQACLIASGQSGRSDAGSITTDPVRLLQAKVTDSTKWKDAGAVADYFLSILFPGEGKANLGQYRQSAMDFLNDGTADSTPSNTLFANLTVSTTAGSTYDTRVRGMVAMLMTFQRFQEQ